MLPEGSLHSMVEEGPSTTNWTQSFGADTEIT